MVKCDNCDNEAHYTSADPGINPVNYCSSCLPAWLHKRAAAGHFPLVEPSVEDEEKTQKKKTAKSPE